MRVPASRPHARVPNRRPGGSVREAPPRRPTESADAFRAGPPPPLDGRSPGSRDALAAGVAVTDGGRQARRSCGPPTNVAAGRPPRRPQAVRASANRCSLTGLHRAGDAPPVIASAKTVPAVPTSTRLGFAASGLNCHQPRPAAKAASASNASRISFLRAAMQHLPVWLL